MKSNDANDTYRGHAAELREAKRIAAQRDVENRIREENDEFVAMTPAQKRVRIAKDVLGWMKVGRLVAKVGIYIDLFKEDGRSSYSRSVNGYECHACALGSVFAVAVERGAAKSPVGLMSLDQESMHARLAEFFDRHQLLMIEDAFESRVDSCNQRATDFCVDIPKYIDGNPRLRMERIMRNIIANDGTFVP